MKELLLYDFGLLLYLFIILGYLYFIEKDMFRIFVVNFNIFDESWFDSIFRLVLIKWELLF